MAQHWLLKTEPETYSFSRLLKDRKTNWNGVRNFQARNFLREMEKGDLALIYHSGDDKCVVGVSEVSRPGYADPDPEKPGEWVQVDLVPVKEFKRTISLQEIKSTASLADLMLIKQSRLSVMPITKKHYDTLVKLGSV
jgi:predicted RNA-binding protein with PUA-like domain